MRNVLSALLSCTELSSFLSHCGRETRPRLGSSIHAAIIKAASRFNPNTLAEPRDATVVWNSLLAMYSKCGQPHDASKVFEEMPERDTVSWNSMLSSFFAGKEYSKGFDYFNRMRSWKDCMHDHATLTILLSICANLDHWYACSMLHSLIISSGCGSAVNIGNALITAYFRCCYPLSAEMVFDSMVERNVITWTAMVSGLGQSQLFKESFLLFREMLRVEEANSVTFASSLLACSGMRTICEGQQIHGRIHKSGLSGLHVEGALMDMYVKCSVIEDALQLFYSCAEPDEVILTVLLVGYAQNGLEERAFIMFSDMVRKGIEVDESMVSAVLGAFGCASQPFGLALGKQIHSLGVKKCFLSNTFVCNGLLNMYSKCGELKDSIKLFELIQDKNSVSWNSMIAALGHHGYGSEALLLYQEMISYGIEPTDVTYLSLLHTCSHVGYVEKGIGLLRLMTTFHGITPRIEHYACVVDMLGRAGQLHEARSLIERLHVESSDLLWQALLGACGIHGDLEMGRYAAEKLVLISPECTSAYVLLSNIYSSGCEWEGRARTIKRMKEKGIKKETGMSWIELGKKFHCFVVGDDLHPQADSIYEALNGLIALEGDVGDVMDEKLVLNEL